MAQLSADNRARQQTHCKCEGLGLHYRVVGCGTCLGCVVWRAGPWAVRGCSVHGLAYFMLPAAMSGVMYVGRCPVVANGTRQLEDRPSCSSIT